MRTGLGHICQENIPRKLSRNGRTITRPPAAVGSKSVDVGTKKDGGEAFRNKLT